MQRLANLARVHRVDVGGVLRIERDRSHLAVVAPTVRWAAR
ncbi:hypothetical protein GGR61_001242 [Xanthomonas arboricola]|nr:hypothetical protein [Xanthomonas sp. 3058]